jgi:transcriptional regulator with XRE-family HTH domain
MDKDYGLSDVVERMKQTRLRCGMSQLELANRANLSQSFLGSIEAGKKQPSVLTLLKIASALNVNPGEFFPKEMKDKGKIKAEIVSLIEML